MKTGMKAVADIMLMIAVVCTTGCTKLDEPNNGGGANTGGNNGSGNGVCNGHEYVDLGLPSGILWATCNVGADTPEGYGDQFAWGETRPKDDEYDWDNYKWYGGSDEIGYVAYVTKYCTNSIFGYNGFTDNLTTLQFADDAATANWGGGWRTPTREEWYELIAYTTPVYTTQNGVNGMLFTATNGNCVFLVDSEWDYWSSSLHARDSDAAYCYCFDDSDDAGVSSYWRPYGKNIRAVRDNSSFVVVATANPMKGGEVTGGGAYNGSSICTLTATAFDGYSFLNWSEDTEVVSTDATYSFVVSRDRCLVANFVYSAENCEYVDLNLPSGLLWATCNVGATTSEEFGGYFAWGEILPKDIYDWNTYKYCYDDRYQLTKYCDDTEYGYNGFTDNLTELMADDDVARVCWGDAWRMPKFSEWLELYENTTLDENAIQNGVKGWLFTASNGKSVFLPAAGCRHDDWNYGFDNHVIYWSSSLGSCEGLSPDHALYFGNAVLIDIGNREYGLPVRPVRSAK